MADKSKKGSRTVTGRERIVLKDNCDKNFELIKEIKHSPLYGKSQRDPIARKYILENAENLNHNNLVPGQLVLFNYFEPKTEEQLEYYDAGPCTIFFGIFNSKEGKRYLGFNIHYYPPKMRYAIMDKIFEMYRPIMAKYFKEGNSKEIDAFDYKYLVDNLKRQNLDFGVREYVPNLIAEAKIVPPRMWEVAVFTEGWFKKATRTAIMNFWERWLRGTKKSGNVHKGYKSRTKKSVQS